MSDNPKISFELKEFLVGMKNDILEDSKKRHENHETVTNTNFSNLKDSSKAHCDWMADHANSTRWMLMAFIAIVSLAIAYTELKGNAANSNVPATQENNCN